MTPRSETETAYACVGCGHPVPITDLSTHDRECDHHAWRLGAGGWGRCSHEGSCYRATPDPMDRSTE